MRGHSFANTVIRSRKRLTYAQALALLEEDDLDKIKKLPVPPAHQTGSTGRPLKSVPFKELKQIQHDLRKLWSFAEKMRAKRIKNGSLDLDMPEVKIYVDEEGYADRIVRNENDISHQLIEEFMLAANEMVAHTLHRVGMPCIYRVHDEPDPDKLDELREVVLLAGIQIGDLNNRKEMNRLLQALKEHEQGYTMRIQLLRSLKQACYRAEADGHYGLAKEDYTHFTSPIRRYADLIVHRIFDAFLVKQGLETAPKEPPPHYDQGRLVSIAEHISITEQNSTEAERESKKIKLLEFFERETQKKKKSTFEAIITDIKNHGMFIELTESMAFGLIHISTLDDDWWTVHNDGTELRARRSKTVFRIGDRVEVQVERIDRFKRQIDFRLTSTKVRPSGVEPTMLKPDPSPRRKKKKRSRRQT